MTTSPVLHVLGAADWAEARRAGAVGRDGAPFLHLCTPEQLPSVVGRFFPGVADLVAVELDAGRPGVVFERGDPPLPERPDEQFPHLYADLPVGWVTAVHPLVG